MTQITCVFALCSLFKFQIHDLSEICHLKFCTKINYCYHSETLTRPQINEKLGVKLLMNAPV